VSRTALFRGRMHLLGETLDVFRCCDTVSERRDTLLGGTLDLSVRRNTVLGGTLDLSVRRNTDLGGTLDLSERRNTL
jgi:hypothetical protein